MTPTKAEVESGLTLVYDPVTAKEIAETVRQHFVALEKLDENYD